MTTATALPNWMFWPRGASIPPRFRTRSANANCALPGRTTFPDGLENRFDARRRVGLDSSRLGRGKRARLALSGAEGY